MGKSDLFIKIHRPIIELASSIPSEDNLILMGNHPHRLDPLLVSSLSPKMMVVKNDDEKGSSLYRSINCDLTKNSMGNLSNLFIALIENNVLCIFREGEINDSDELKKFMKGAMTLAVRSKSKIMPFAITGSYNLFTKDRLTIRVGESFETEGMKEKELEGYLKNKILELKKK